MVCKGLVSHAAQHFLTWRSIAGRDRVQVIFHSPPPSRPSRLRLHLFFRGNRAELSRAPILPCMFYHGFQIIFSLRWVYPRTSCMPSSSLPSVQPARAWAVLCLCDKPMSACHVKSLRSVNRARTTHWQDPHAHSLAARCFGCPRCVNFGGCCFRCFFFKSSSAALAASISNRWSTWRSLLSGGTYFLNCPASVSPAPKSHFPNCPPNVHLPPHM